MKTPGYRLGDLAERVGGEIRGDPDRIVEGIQPLDAAGPGDLSFLTHSRYRRLARASRAGALMVGPKDADLKGDLLVVEDPSFALAQLLEFLHPAASPSPGVHPTAIVEEGCTVDPSATVGACAVIGTGSRIGPGVVIHPLVVVGRGCQVEAGAVLHPHVVLYDGTEIGERAIIHAGTVLGADGFGYATREGVHHKIPQVGRVVVGAEVEIGANSAVDRATLGATRIGEGSKLDNLVQVGHNVEIGPRSILCGQVGIAGSARLGAGVVVGGRGGTSGHLEVGDGVQIAATAVTFKSVPPGQQVAGVPAVEIGRWRRQVALLSRLEEMFRRLQALEREHRTRREEEGGE